MIFPNFCVGFGYSKDISFIQCCSKFTPNRKIYFSRFVSYNDISNFITIIGPGNAVNSELSFSSCWARIHYTYLTTITVRLQFFEVAFKSFTQLTGSISGLCWFWPAGPLFRSIKILFNLFSVNIFNTWWSNWVVSGVVNNEILVL